MVPISDVHVRRVIPLKDKESDMRGCDYKTRHETLSVNGLDVFYRHAGDRTKPGLLMLHGFPTSSHMYRKLIEPLAESAYVVAPDLPGFGFSSAPPLDQ